MPNEYFGRNATCDVVAAGVAIGVPASASANGEVNIYSARHYATDDVLFNAFKKRTGIAVNRIEVKSDKLIARVEAEGLNSSADVFLTGDAGRIWRADHRVTKPTSFAALSRANATSRSATTITSCAPSWAMSRG